MLITAMWTLGMSSVAAFREHATLGVVIHPSVEDVLLISMLVLGSFWLVNVFRTVDPQVTARQRRQRRIFACVEAFLALLVLFNLGVGGSSG